MSLRPLTFIVSALLPFSVPSAQDLLECVDPDVREGLLFQGFDSNVVVSRQLPALMQSVTIGGDFKFIGSSVSDIQTSIAYKTAQPPDAAVREMTAALESAGWKDFGVQTTPQGGFVTGSVPLYAALCKDQQTITLLSRESDDATFVNLRSVNQAVTQCAAMASRGATAAAGSIGFHLGELMPRLTLPAGAQPAGLQGRLGATGVSGSNRSATTNVTIETELGAASLAEHFRDELEQQDWLMDGNWTASVSAGSTWTATRDENLKLIGLLDVIAIGGSTYEATFRLTALE